MSLVSVSQGQGRVPVTILHVHDRINLGNVAELEKAAQAAYAGGARDLLIDLAEAPSVTSAGLRAILSIYRLLGGDVAQAAPPGTPWKSAHFKLCNATAYVHDVLSTAGFTDYIDVHVSVQEALAAF